MLIERVSIIYCVLANSRNKLFAGVERRKYRVKITLYKVYKWFGISVEATNSKIQDQAGHDPTMQITSHYCSIENDWACHSSMDRDTQCNSRNQKELITCLEGRERARSTQRYWWCVGETLAASHPSLQLNECQKLPNKWIRTYLYLDIFISVLLGAFLQWI